jgi:hypothetical protein
VWRSLVAHLHGVQGVEGSNPFTPTIRTSKGVRFNTPDALFHWAVGRLMSKGVHRNSVTALGAMVSALGGTRFFAHEVIDALLDLFNQGVGDP